MRSASRRSTQNAGSASRTPVGAASASTARKLSPDSQRMSSVSPAQRRNRSDNCVAASGSIVLQRAPVEDPGQRQLQRRRAQARHGVDVEHLGADPADLAGRALLGAACPAAPTRPPAWAARTTAAPTSRTAAHSPAPGFRTWAAGRWRGTGRTAPARFRRAGRARRRCGSATTSDCSQVSKSALAKAITGSSSSGSCTTSLTSTANGLAKSLAGLALQAAQRDRPRRRAAAAALAAAGAAAAGAGMGDAGVLDGSAALGRQRLSVANRSAAAAGVDVRRRWARMHAGRVVVWLKPGVRWARRGTGRAACARRRGRMAHVADHLLLDLVDLGLDRAVGLAQRVAASPLDSESMRDVPPSPPVAPATGLRGAPCAACRTRACARNRCASCARSSPSARTSRGRARAPSSWREFRSAQSVAGLATKRTTLRKKLSPSFGGRCQP